MIETTRSEVRKDVVLPVTAERARDRLCALFGRSTDAPADIGLRLVVGPRPGHLPVKHVHATLTGPQHRGATDVFTLHWEPVGLAASAYPNLDAKVGITPVGTTSSLLSIVACYSPPFGLVGAVADRAALFRVADATVASVLHRLAHAITHTPSPLVGV